MGKIAVKLYHDLQADVIVANATTRRYVEHVHSYRNPLVPYKEVVASRGKWIRAEPVAALYEQDRVRMSGHCRSSRTRCAGLALMERLTERARTG